MRVFFSLKLTLLTCCSPLAPSSARMSACSLPNIPQCAGIHCRTALLVVATCCRALVRFGSLWLWYACRTERASEKNTTCLQSPVKIEIGLSCHGFWWYCVVIIIIIALKDAILDFYNHLTALQTVSNTYTQVAWAQSCANHAQHIERLSRATFCVPLVTKGQLSY